MATYSGIGLMSGTSVDGLDLCYVEFTGDISSDVWGYCIKKAVTVPYTDDWVTRLKQAPSLSGLDLIKLHVEYGHFVGECVSRFIDQGSDQSGLRRFSRPHRVPPAGKTLHLPAGVRGDDVDTPPLSVRLQLQIQRRRARGARRAAGAVGGEVPVSPVRPMYQSGRHR